MRKLIETSQEYLIVCDTPKCEFKVPNKTKNPAIDTKDYVNVACPYCGKNLLTEKDYYDSLVLLKCIDWLNKWFSWITIFTPKKKKRIKATAKVHNGLTIDQEIKS